MEFLKWYSIILIGIIELLQIFEIFINKDYEEKYKSLLGIIITMPVFVYLIMK